MAGTPSELVEHEAGVVLAWHLRLLRASVIYPNSLPINSAEWKDFSASFGGYNASMNTKSSVASPARSACYALALLISTCFQPAHAQEQAISKPEAKDVAGRVRGCVIWTRTPYQLSALSLPEMKESVVRRTAEKGAEFYPLFHAISGPDSKGRIAYIEDHLFVADKKDEKHLLKTVQVDGTNDSELFSRPGNALWAASRAGRGEIGAHLALAPSGGKVAFLSDLSERQMPMALLHEGSIEIWDIERKVKHELTTRALNQPMSWFPDGKRLAYVKLTSRDELPKEAPGLAEFGEYLGQTWDELPTIYVLDIDTEKSSFLHVGWTPVVACDGKSVLVGGWGRADFSWNAFAIQTRKSLPVSWSGGSGEVIAVPEPNVVLYKALPTDGAEVATHYAIKTALVDSEKFQTLVPDLSRQGRVSFGRVMDRD
jgi:hypothetical protein